MRLTKRLMAMLLLVCMVFTLLPTTVLTASAADYTGTGTFEKCTGALTSGYYVFGGGSSTSLSAINNTVGNSWVQYTATTVSSGTITDPATSIVWYYDADAGTFANGSNYVYWPGGNKGGVGTTKDYFTVTETATAGIYNVADQSTTNRLLRLNGTSGYRFYTSSTGSADIYF